ncbi:MULTISPECIES: hypothetical protein [unclassified Microbacterium]|uniref:hypothetical protein n=1 Tax=unclassified Microbacterium TaxID=2609290 RepID=UPI000EAABC43|nr:MULTISPECIES: hypothetical protein [unclassified Microbacterium]MBT2484848.1 hypothetical protein [Microbacterium sp. ISL-108]RKN67718.1 hypothetical protein D7252_09025 [Microbacterium sp. CGR2]
MAYRNGEVPLHKLIHVQNNIWLPAGTLARWNWAVQQGVKKYGVRLRITGQNSTGKYTWNGYRPLSAQKLYRNAFGQLAAVPGWSSHGGWYHNQEVFAIDVDNWAEMGWARFAALMRLAGLRVDFVSPREQWHVGDFNNPWVIPAFASSGSGSHLNPKPAPKPAPKPDESEEDDMEPSYVYNRAPYDRVYVIHPITGKKRPLSKAEWEAAKLNGAKAWDATKAQVDEIKNA